MSGRNLIAVIDAICTVAPELKLILASRRDSVLYTAPELMWLRWQEVADLLNGFAQDHPQSTEIARIFAGKP